MEIKILETDAPELHLDHYSTLTMTYTQEGFTELVGDINKNGLLVPILLRNGKILDGRHRYRACVQLGIPIRYTELGDIPDDKALDIVISNSINKATGTDSSKVEAYLMCKAKGMRQKDMPSLFKRLNPNYIHKMVYIEKEDPKYLQALLRQNSVSLHNKRFDKLEACSTINSIWKILKSNNGMDSDVVEVVPEPIPEVSYDTYIEDVMNSSKAVEQYWEFYSISDSMGFKPHPDSVIGRWAIRTINELDKLRSKESNEES